MDMNNVNNFVVFMTGLRPFPEGVGGSVYINWPSEQNQNTWQLIGHLTNEKPSAIFKISGLQKSELTSSNVFANFNKLTTSQHPHHAQLGISFESLSEISQQVTSIASSTNEQGSVFMEFSNSMLTSFYNYSSSFSKSLDEIINISSFWDKSVANTYFIPTNILENWMKEFQTKLANDFNFLKK